MKENSDLMKALKVTMQAQSIARGVLSNSLNSFQQLEDSSDDDNDDAGDDNEDDTMDEAVDDTVTNNDNVTSYTRSTCSKHIHHTILARCKKISIAPDQEYTTVEPQFTWTTIALYLST